jgi:PIN domain nuclease of toxin-antitoxin system
MLLWAADGDASLPPAALPLIHDADTQLVFSVVSIIEIAIKFSLGRPDFRMDPQVLRRALLENGYLELDLTGDHAVAVSRLPPIHKDPFDRLLAAQAGVEGLTLLTSDATLARYPGPIRQV